MPCLDEIASDVAADAYDELEIEKLLDLKIPCDYCLGESDFTHFDSHLFKCGGCDREAEWDNDKLEVLKPELTQYDIDFILDRLPTLPSDYLLPDCYSQYQADLRGALC